MYTPFTVHKHLDVLCYKDENGQFSVRAFDYIPAGTLLIIEKGIHLPYNELVDTVDSITLLDQTTAELTPRIPFQSFETTQEQRVKVIKEKIRYNTWSWRKKTALFYGLSFFNHSCTPNAFITECFDRKCKYQRKSPNYIYAAIFAVADIEKGEEICIMYNETSGHVIDDIFNWSCTCNQTLEERTQMFNQAGNAAAVWNKENEDDIIDHINDFEGWGTYEELEDALFHHWHVDTEEEKQSSPTSEKEPSDVDDIIDFSFSLDDPMEDCVDVTHTMKELSLVTPTEEEHEEAFDLAAEQCMLFYALQQHEMETVERFFQLNLRLPDVDDNGCMAYALSQFLHDLCVDTTSDTMIRLTVAYIERNNLATHSIYGTYIQSCIEAHANNNKHIQRLLPRQHHDEPMNCS